MSSLFGPPTDGDYRRWQGRNLRAVTELVQYGIKRDLPVLYWTLPSLGTPTGKVDTLGELGAGRLPRDVFEAWCAALAKHPRVKRRGLGHRGDLPSRSERTSDTGRTSMMAGFELTTTKAGDRAEFVVTAEWFDSDLERHDTVGGEA